MTHYESKAIAIIRESPTWAYWCISRRVYEALRRLEKRGVIKWEVKDYPYWKFTITAPAPHCPAIGDERKV